MSCDTSGLLGVFENAAVALVVNCIRERFVHLFDRGVPLEGRDEVHDRADRDRHSQARCRRVDPLAAAALRPPLGWRPSWSARSKRPPRACGADRCRAAGTRLVQERLITGVGMHGRHESLRDAEAFVEDASHRREAVRRARRIRHHGVGRGVVVAFVHPDADRKVNTLAGRGDDDSTRTRLEVGRRRLRAIGNAHWLRQQLLRRGPTTGSRWARRIRLPQYPARRRANRVPSPRPRCRDDRQLSRVRAGMRVSPGAAFGSFIATISMVPGGCRSSRTRAKERPIRPKPLMPTRTVMKISSARANSAIRRSGRMLLVLCRSRRSHSQRASAPGRGRSARSPRRARYIRSAASARVRPSASSDESAVSEASMTACCVNSADCSALPARSVCRSVSA